MARKLDILIPVYNEESEVIIPLLDSICIQQNVDLKNDIGVIICCDGGDFKLPDTSRYPFKVEFYNMEHKGVSATRNACLDHSSAKYVMFCDCDDMFFNCCAFYVIFREMEGAGFDTLISAFIEETRDEKKNVVYINHEIDSTFVHGKVHRRKFLINNNIRWNDELTIHEDSYFNCLCQKLADKTKAKYCPQAFYLWRWRDASVCRHDPKYILKTYNNMLDSNTALVNQFIDRGRTEDAQFYVSNMIFDAYFTLNKKEWINQESSEYRKAVEARFKKYYLEFKELFDSIDEQIKNQIVYGIKNRMFTEGLILEQITFDDWINFVMKNY